MHGYDIRKSLREDFGVLSNLSFGSLYPALARLEASLAVRAVEPAPPLRRSRRAAEGMPLTGSLTGERAALVAARTTAKAAIALGWVRKKAGSFQTFVISSSKSSGVGGPMIVEMRCASAVLASIP